MIIPDKSSYFQKLEEFEIIPFTQSKGWYAMHSLYKPERIIFLFNNIENPSIACFAHEKTFLGVKMLLIEGEAYKDAKSCNLNDIRSFYQSLTKSGYPIIESASNAIYDFNYETALRQAGFLRPVGMFSLPVTKIINLKSIHYDSNWRYYVKKSTSEDLSFEAVTDVNEKDAADFIGIYNEMMKIKSVAGFFDISQLTQLLLDTHFQLFFMSHRGKRISAIITYRQVSHVSLLYAVSNAEGRKHFASFALYDSIFRHFAAQEIQTFDMEKLLPSTDEVNGVFRFKNGVSGDYRQLNAEWSWYKNSVYRSSMYFVKKHLMKKREL